MAKFRAKVVIKEILVCLFFHQGQRVCKVSPSAAGEAAVRQVPRTAGQLGGNRVCKPWGFPLGSRILLLRIAPKEEVGAGLPCREFPAEVLIEGGFGAIKIGNNVRVQRPVWWPLPLRRLS